MEKKPLTKHPKTRGGINERTTFIRVYFFLIISTITTVQTWVTKKGQLRIRYAEHFAAHK